MAYAERPVPGARERPARSDRAGGGRLGARAARPPRRPAADLPPDGQGQGGAGTGPRRVAAVRTGPRGHPRSAGMSDSTLNALKVLVERAVRPVRASLP